MNLKQKTIHGVMWSGISQAGKQISQFVITAILARLLSPKDFGLLGMATVFTGFAAIFGELGISSALIQKQDIDEAHLSSAFWLNIMVGVSLTTIFILMAPLIARFYNKPELRMILMIMSVNFILSSFTIIQQTVLTKEMNFKALTIRDIVGIILSGVVGISFAYKGYGVWSLVYQLLSFTFINSILLWKLSKWRPKFIFSKQSIVDIFHFSVNLTGFNIVNYFARNTDQLLIGKFLGAQALGFYSLAYRLMLYPLQNISAVIGKVMFPAFSKVQNNLEKVRNAYKKMVKAISLVTFPMMASLFIIVPEFVNAVFGPKWEPIIILVRIFCICGAVQSVGTTVGNILLSQGRADLQFKMQIFSTPIVVASIIIGMKWGIVGVAIFYTFQSLIWVHISFYITNRIINLKYHEFYLKLINSYLIGFIILAILFFLKYLITLPVYYKIAALILIGTVVYSTLLFVAGEIYFKDRKLIIKVLQ